MLIKYVFVTGEELEIEVADDIGIVIQDSRRAEHANNEKQRYHSAFSLNNAGYEGCIFSSGGELIAQLIKMEENRECEEMLQQLTPIQRRRIEMLMSGMSIADIARSEDASFNSVKESIEAARKKLINLL